MTKNEAMKNTEIEIKLVLPEGGLAKLLGSQLWQQAVEPASRKVRLLESCYYDTQSMALMRKGLAYRVRGKGDGSFEATVKAKLASEGGFSRRLELNLPLKEPRAELNGFAALGLGFELSELAPQGVDKLFTVSVERTTYILHCGASLVELAMDKGAITSQRVPGASEPIDELELELLSGSEKELRAWAQQLSELTGAQGEERSKFARGLALIGIER